MIVFKAIVETRNRELAAMILGSFGIHVVGHSICLEDTQNTGRLTREREGSLPDEGKVKTIRGRWS